MTLALVSELSALCSLSRAVLERSSALCGPQRRAEHSVHMALCNAEERGALVAPWATRHLPSEQAHQTPCRTRLPSTRVTRGAGWGAGAAKLWPPSAGPERTGPWRGPVGFD